MKKSLFLLPALFAATTSASAQKYQGEVRRPEIVMLIELPSQPTASAARRPKSKSFLGDDYPAQGAPLEVHVETQQSADLEEQKLADERREMIEKAMDYKPGTLTKELAAKFPEFFSPDGQSRIGELPDPAKVRQDLKNIAAEGDSTPGLDRPQGSPSKDQHQKLPARQAQSQKQESKPDAVTSADAQNDPLLKRLQGLDLVRPLRQNHLDLGQ